MPLHGFAVYITDNTTKSKIELPVNPAEIELKYETNDKSENILNLGEFISYKKNPVYQLKKIMET